MPDNWGIPTKKETTLFQTKAGDRTLTPVQKRKVKEEQGYKCAICKKKFHPRLLEIHHKKEVHKHKSKFGVEMAVLSFGKKIKPHSDKRSNLEAVCIHCHDKTKSKKGRSELSKKNVKKKTAKKKVKKKQSLNSLISKDLFGGL